MHGCEPVSAVDQPKQKARVLEFFLKEVGAVLHDINVGLGSSCASDFVYPIHARSDKGQFFRTWLVFIEKENLSNMILTRPE